MAAKPKGPRAIDAIRASYTAERRQITIPEWGDLVLYFGPITVADMEAVDQREPKSSYDRNLFLLVAKAKDASGKALFQMGDLHFLKTETDMTVLQRVIAFMWADVPSPEKADAALKEGNSDSGSDSRAS